MHASNTQAESNKLCWTCKHVVNPDNASFCAACHPEKQDEPKKVDFFTLLRLPVSFFVDQSTLERNFQSLQRVVHPDRWVSKSKDEQAVAMGRSAAASEAYQTLKDPMLRARYLLSLRGIDLERCPLEDPALLMEVMEERENLDSLKGSAESRRKALDHSLARCQSIIDESLRVAQDLFQNHGDNALTPVTHLIIRVQYYNRLANHARSTLEALERSDHDDDGASAQRGGEQEDARSRKD